MKLPSIDVLWLNFKNVVNRFPLQVLIAILATGIWWYLAGPNADKAYANDLVKLMLVFNFAVTLLLATDTYSESQLLAAKIKWLFRLIALAFLTALYFLLDPFQFTNDIFRMALFAFSFHLLVAFSPFIGRGKLNGFWQYNKTLFLRFLTAAFYAAVLFGGLAIALVAVDGLFNADIKSYHYIRLFALMSAGFTTIFFLAGVPQNFDELEEEQNYPKGLKIFTQYVLIPLMTIYLAILLVYEIKIAINWELPKGLVSTLILGYAVFGILSLLLIYPIKEKEGNGWMKLFSRFFYLMMIPLVVLLILAVVKRVGNYGITESRYILIILAVWLTGITIYFLFSKKQNIKVIPISLFVLALLSIYGPQSAFSISKASQIARLKKLMVSKDTEERSEIPNVVRYLVERHGLATLQSFTDSNLKEIEDKISIKGKQKNANYYEVKAEKIDTAFALLKVKEDFFSDGRHGITFENSDNELMNVKGYDVMKNIESYFTSSVFEFDGKKIELFNSRLKGNSNYAEKLIIKVNGTTSVLDIHKLAAKLMLANQKDQFKQKQSQSFIAPAELMRLSQQNSGYTFTFVATRMYGSYRNPKNDFEELNFDGYLLIKKN